MFSFERTKDTLLNYDSQERNVNFYFLTSYTFYRKHEQYIQISLKTISFEAYKLYIVTILTLPH